MSRAGAIIVGAAALLLGTVSGCTLDATSLNVFTASNEREWVMDGSLESVSSSSQKTLHDMKVSVDVTNDADTVRIRSCTNLKDSKRFTLVLNRVKTPNGEKTRVRIDWGEDGSDVQFWWKLVEEVHNNQSPGDHADEARKLN